MNTALLQQIEQLLGNKITYKQPISGGDTAAVYQLQTAHDSFILKTTNGQNAQAMFEAEKNGLEQIAKSNTIATPEVIGCDKVAGTAFLLLEYIPTQNGNKLQFEQFGRQLAQLHQSTNVQFGNSADNFIGPLEQSNTQHNQWVDFYAHERLWPQLQLAVHHQLLPLHMLPYQHTILEQLKNLFPTTRPSLLHGDLWSGNYLIGTNGNAYLIDPSCYYGHHEVDIAMSRLFGGFDRAFYDAYFEIIPRESYYQERLELYQLYYLLVHLNLFGHSYYASVKSILDRYFSL